MAGRKIVWREPEDNTVTGIEINRGTTAYGTYTVLTTIAATSDAAAKSATNTWVTSYYDVAGLSTNWYKLRFTDGTYFSDYSDVTTDNKSEKLCSVEDIKKILNTVGRWSDSEIFDAISEEDSIIYTEMGTPIAGIWTEMGKINDTVQSRYYVGEENIYRIDRVYYGTTTKSELYLDDQYKVNTKHGMIEILPVASSGITPDIDCNIEVHYVPNLFHKLCIYRTCKHLLEQLDMTSGGTISKELEVIMNRLTNLETILANKVCLRLSSEFEYYDKHYGTNLTHVVQDHDRNLYMSDKNWN